jgi:hypothetical protein
MKGFLRLFRMQPRTMKAPAPSAVCTQAETAAVTALDPHETITAASRHLRELADALDTHDTSVAVEVGASLQRLSEQLLQLQHTPAAAISTPAATDIQPTGAEPAAAGLEPAAAGGERKAGVEKAGEAADTATPAAADVEVLERSYAAPAAAGAADTEELKALQPLTKKQRRGREPCCLS